MAGNVALRKALDQAVELPTVGEYRAELDRLRHKYGHRIEVLPDNPSASPTCFAYALGLGDDPQYLQKVIARGQDGKAPVNSDVVKNLVKSGVLQARVGPSCVGDVVLYAKGARYQHAGVVAGPDEIIRSKWGGHEVHLHRIWEVPMRYGTTCGIYLPPDPARIIGSLSD